MPQEFSVPDFAGAAQTVDAQRAGVDAAVRRGLVPADIAAALSSPQASSWLLSQGFEVVESLESLRGPDTGTVAVPGRLVDRELPARADLDRAWQRLLLYRRLLSGGTAAEQCTLLNRTLLNQLWPARLGPPVVLQVWERRFPELSGHPAP
jgi:hypothetical protein